MENLKFDLSKVHAAYKDRAGHVNADDLASHFGTTKNTLYTWKRGDGLEKVKVIIKIMQETGLSFEELFNLNKMTLKPIKQ